MADNITWADVLDDIIEIAKNSHSTGEIAERCSDLMGRRVTYNAVSSALRRLRRDGQDIPQLADVMGSDRGSAGQFTCEGPGLRIPKECTPEKTVEPEGTVYIPKIPNKVLVIPDIHFPIEDKAALAALMAFAQDAKPDMILQLGDTYDFYGLSSFGHSQKRMTSYGGRIWEEAQSAIPFWNECLSITKNVAMIAGNHEYRLERLIDANPALFSHPAFSLHNFLDIPKAIKIYPYRTKLYIGETMFSHGDKLGNWRQAPKYLAQRVLDVRPTSHTIFGHFHRIETKSHVLYGPSGPETYSASCVGHLSDTDQQTYVANPQWNHGFALIEYWQDGNKTRHHTSIIEIINGKFKFGGKLYTGK